MEKILNESSLKKLNALNWIILIFSTSLFFFSIPAYKIFPEIPSDSPQLERNLEEEVTIEGCISAVTSIDFVDYAGIEINFSDYNLLGIYKPFNKYEHRRHLENDSYEYKYTNESFEDGYEAKEITNRYKEIYYFNDKVIKVKKTQYMTNLHYNVSTHSCVSGYKSCGKVENQFFRLFCVPESDECPIKKLVNFQLDTYTGFNTSETVIVKKLRDRSFFHYLHYNENDTIRNLYLDFAIADSFRDDLFYLRLFKISNVDYKYNFTDYNFTYFKNQNNISEVYPTYKGNNVYLGSNVINLSSYTDLKCKVRENNPLPDPEPENSNTTNNNNSNTNNNNSGNQNSTNTNNNNSGNQNPSNTNNNNSGNQNPSNTNNNNSGNQNPSNTNNPYPNNGNSGNGGVTIYGNNIQDVKLTYNDSKLIEFRNEMKSKFERGLFLSVCITFICIFFNLLEILILNKLDFDDSSTLFYIFSILRILQFIFIFIIFVHEIYLLDHYKFNVANILFIPYSKLIHGIYMSLCIIIILLDCGALYFLFKLLKVFKKEKRKYKEIKQVQATTQNDNIPEIKSHNDSEMKMEPKDSENLVIPRPAQNNNIPTTVIKIKK